MREREKSRREIERGNRDRDRERERPEGKHIGQPEKTLKGRDQQSDSEIFLLCSYLRDTDQVVKLLPESGHCRGHRSGHFDRLCQGSECCQGGLE